MRRIGKKMLLYIGMAIFFFLGYHYVAEVTAARSGETSFLTPIDGMIPFIPEFVFPYMSLYALFWLPVIVGRNITLRDFATIIVATAIMFTTAFTIYAIIPSRYPRPEISPDTSFVYYVLANALYAYDLPNNTLPSTHAGVVAILLAATWKKFGRRTYAVYALWGASILLSTVTVKQHYIVDLLSGIVLGIAAFAIARRIVRQKT